MTEDLRCPDCNSPAVILPRATNERAAVRCGGCGKLLATRAQFRRLLERHATKSRLVTTGC